MKHLLDITKFLSEALTPEFKEKYRKHFEKRTPEVIARLNKILDNKERVYIPYDGVTISKTQEKVSYYLSSTRYEIFDYKQNLAVRIDDPNRKIRISKLLAQTPALLKEFTLDDTRANTRAGSEFSIVLTSNYEDVAGMSFDRCWTNSCLDIKRGQNKKYVKHEVQEGTIVAYLIKSDDLEIENPLGRVNIKPYIHGKSPSQVIYAADVSIYGNVPDKKLFLKTIEEYLNQKQKVEYAGTYIKRDGLYSDSGSPLTIKVRKDGYDEEGYDKEGYDKMGYDKKGYDKEKYDRGGWGLDGYNKEGYNKDGGHKTDKYDDHLTMEQYNFLSRVIVDHTTGNFPLSNPYSINELGLVDTKHSVKIYKSTFLRLLKLPISFGRVDGHFIVRDIELETLEGFPKHIIGEFYCDGNNLKNLIGAPQTVGGVFDCRDNQLTSLEGGPIEVGGFRVNENNLTDLVGAPQLVRGFFNCDGNALVSLVGAPKEVWSGFSCTDQRSGIVFSTEEVMSVCKVNSGAIYV